MKIAINTQALQTGYRLQGTGNYIRHLREGLTNRKDQQRYLFYERDAELPPVELVHIPYFSPFQPVLPLLKPAKKLVLTIHDLIPVIFRKFFPPGIRGSFYWYLQRLILQKHVDYVIADSQATKADIVTYLGLDAAEVAVIYLAADKRFRPLDKKYRQSSQRQLRQKYNLPEEFVLYVGDALWSKNIPLLIAAVKTINVSLVLVGRQFVDEQIDLQHPWNSDLAQVRKLIKNDKRIMPLGYVSADDLLQLYNMALVYCQPSHYEGFGLPVLEAMACGCPVVVTRQGSLPEVVGEAGIYVDPADVRNIADGIGEIYFNADLYARYKNLGLKQAKKFSWEKTVKQTVAVYNTVLAH